MLIIFIAPHQNCRYQASLEKLSHAELELMLRAAGVELAAEPRVYAGKTAFCVDIAQADPRLERLLAGMSSLYMVCRAEKDGALYPAFGRRPAYLGDDISGILKYKGKTSEAFTRLLLNVARMSSAFALNDGPLDVLDPVCGRGTTLLEAINAGDNAFGIDVDVKALDELSAFLKKYMVFHHLKHRTQEGSLTVAGKPKRMWLLTAAAESADYKAGNTRSIELVNADTMLADKLFPRKRFHILAGDLPYGVQHATHSGDIRTMFTPDKNSNDTKLSRHNKTAAIEQFTAQAVPVWADMLLPGGAMALSFNAYTLRRDALRAQLRACGLEVCEGGAYDRMEHWVEQAVKRDIVAAVKPLR